MNILAISNYFTLISNKFDWIIANIRNFLNFVIIGFTCITVILKIFSRSIVSAKSLYNKNTLFKLFILLKLKLTIIKNHYVLIKDDSDLKLGRIIDVLPSEEDSEIRSCLVKTKHSQGVYPTSKLRYLEGYSGEEIPLSNNDVVANQPDALARDKLPRDAKEQAKQKLKKLNLHLVGMFLSMTGRKGLQNQWDFSFLGDLESPS